MNNLLTNNEHEQLIESLETIICEYFDNNIHMLPKYNFDDSLYDYLYNILYEQLYLVYDNNLNKIKCFPVFVSKSFHKPVNNVYLVGDAFFWAVTGVISLFSIKESKSI